MAHAVLSLRRVIKMKRFFSKSQFIRHFPTTDDSLICTVGYDDFRTVKPLYAYRVQSFYTWHFIISGSGTLEMDGKVHKIEKGQMFFIPPSVEMRYFPNEDDPWEYVWFSLIGAAAAKYGETLGFTVQNPAISFDAYPGVINRLKHLFCSLTEENGGVFSALSAFYGLLEICTANAVPTGIHAVKKYLDESFALPGFSVEQLCYDAGISHAHMLRLFRQAFGCSVIQYVVAKRIELACELLRTTKLSVKSVAYSCGFSDEQHFMKSFKRHMGISALQYRKNFEAHGS